MQPIRTALLSFGMSGRVFHAPFIHQHPGYELYAVWERNKSESAAIYPDIKIVRSYEELLNDDNIQLIIVNTPTNTHFDFASKALEAGKSVVVEKAFTTTVAEAITLRDLAKKKKLILSVYQNRRWDSDYQTVRQVIQSGALGAVRDVIFQFDRYKEAISVKAHKEQPGPGAGLLNDLGPHLIDQALYLFGVPEAVFADIRILREASLVDDYFDLLLYYPDIRVRLKSSLLVKEPLPSFVVHGQSGSFIKSRADIQEAALIGGAVPGTSDWGKEPVSEEGWLHTQINGYDERKQVDTLRGDYGQYYELLFQAISHQQAPPVTAEDGVHVMQVIEAARKSHEEKRTITL